MADSSPGRVVCVDRHLLLAECLDIALSSRGHDCRVEVPSAGSTQNATLAAIGRDRPDVVVMEFDLSYAWDGMGLIEPLVSLDASVIVVTQSSDLARWGEALVRGAQVVLPKAAPLETISVVIEQIRGGRSVLSHEQRQAFVEAYRRPSKTRHDYCARLERLTGREKEILVQLMAGRTVSEITRASVVSEATVRTQVRSILTKLEVSSQLAAVSLAHKVRWPFAA